MKVRDALQHEARSCGTKKLKYLDHSRFDGNVLVVMYSVDSHIMIGSKEDTLRQTRLAVFAGSQCQVSIITYSEWVQ